jgi:hypothetical protein
MCEFFGTIIAIILTKDANLSDWNGVHADTPFPVL